MILGDLIAEGNTAKIYLSEDKIVKIFKDGLPDTEPLFEAKKQEHAYSCGLAVPKVLEVTEVNGKNAIVMEYVKGRTLGQLFTEHPERVEDYLNISVDIQQKIHSIKPNSLELMVDKLQRQIEDANLLNHEQKSMLLNQLESITFENMLCHGDFHLYNLIESDGKIVIIDWVDSSAGDIRADVYRTYLLYSQLSADLANMYLQIYCKKSGLLESEIFQWAPIIAGARLSENVSGENAERLLEIVQNYGKEEGF